MCCPFLLDFVPFRTKPTVPSTPLPAPVELQQLRLDDAQALLSRDGVLQTLDGQESATVYLQRVIDGLCELSLKDPLTGLSNRRHFHNMLDKTIDVVARSGDPALLLMLDIDYFKKVNDSYGHQSGDQVLRAVAQALAQCVRPMDTVARYGGEEFAVIMPDCQTAFGFSVAERIRQTMQDMSIMLSPGVEIRVTVSIGGAYAPEWVRSTAALWTERADALLYRAKNEGRNRVLLDSQQEIHVSAEEKNMLFGHLGLGDALWVDSVGADNGADGTHSMRAN